MTVTSAPDTDGVDDVLVVTHTAASTGADFSGVTASLAATETDNNSAPESESFTVYVKPKSSATRTRTLVSDFPFKDDDTDRLAYVNHRDAARRRAGRAQAAQDVAALPLQLRLPGHPVRSRGGPSALMFSTQNWNTAQTAHVTLPAKPAADVTVTLGQSGVTFTPSTLTFTPTNWNTAQPVAVKLSSQPQVTEKLNLPALTGLTHLDTTYVWSPTELTFNTSNWTTWQSATIKMSEQPETNVTVTLAKAGVEFNPSTLTFTPSDWNTAQTVQIRRTGAPQVYLALTSGRNVPNDQWQGSRFRQVMEFYPTDAFSSATFTFRVEDWAGNISDDVYTATLLLEGTAPAAVTGFAAAAGNGEVTLSWDDPNDSTITHYEYRWRRYKGSHEWSTWQTVTTPVTPDPATLPFTTTDYGTAQTATVALAAEPAASVTVRLAAVDAAGNDVANVEFTPATLTFTTDNWNTAQSSVKFTQAPAADITITIVGVTVGATGYTKTGLTNGTAYEFQVRAVNPGGRSPHSEPLSVSATPRGPGAPNTPSGLAAAGGDDGVALTWTDPGDASITRYQWRQRAVEGNLTAIAGNAEVALSWRNPHGPAIPDYQYRYRAGTGDWTGWTALRGLTSTSHTVTGLTNDAKHTFEVRRYFSGDHLSTPSPLIALKTVGRYGYGVLDSDSKVTLTWSTPSDTSGISGWQQRSRVGAGAWTSWTDVPSSTATTASWRTDALTTGTAYTYEVRPVRSGQTTATDRWEFTAVAAGSVTMTWADPADDYVVGYEVKRDVRTGSSTPARPVGRDARERRIDDLVHGGRPRQRHVPHLQRPRDDAPPARHRHRHPLGERGVDGHHARAGRQPGVADLRREQLEHRADGDPQARRPAGVRRAGDARAGRRRVHRVQVHLHDDELEHHAERQRGAHGAAAGERRGQSRRRALGERGGARRDGADARRGVRLPAPRRQNAVGTSAATGWALAPMKPAKPAGLTAVPGDASVTLSWTAPSPADPTIDKWQYTKDAGTTWTDICDASSDSSCASRTSFVVTGLTNGTSYTFKIRAVNEAGNGPESDAITGVSPRAAPLKPTGLTAAPANGEVTLTWTDPSDSDITAWEYRRTEPEGGLTAFPGDRSVELSWSAPSSTAGITKWQYRHKRTRVYSYYDGNWYSELYREWIDIPSSSATTTSHTVSGLSSTEYHFQVRAVNASGQLVGSVLGDPTVTPTATAGWTAITGGTPTTVTLTGLTNGRRTPSRCGRGASAPSAPPRTS